MQKSIYQIGCITDTLTNRKVIVSTNIFNIGYNFPLSIKNNFLTCCRLLIFNIIYLSFISVVKSFGFPGLAKIPCVLLLLAIAVMPTLVASDYSICHNAIFLKIFQFFALARTRISIRQEQD